jgi:GLPGLI family protein
MSRILILLTFFYATAAARAQNNTVFISQGKIEYERSTNLYAQISKDDDGEWTELRKKASTHFKTAYFDLLFNRNKSLYRPGRESNDKDNSIFIQAPAQNNTIWSDLDNAKGISQKNIFEELFLVQDSLRKIKWKITAETRNIAGFSCRRANAIIMDSIYVVAFYTDEILTSGGPESFSGLPGMILGVSLPHEHVSWFATKVEAIPVPDSQLAPPVKGKKTTNTNLTETVRQGMKDWGKEGQRFMRAALL